jgi:hypothetical protein
MGIGTVALLVLAVGVILWPREPARVGDGVSPVTPRPELNKPDASAAIKSPAQSVAATSLEPAENATAAPATSAAADAPAASKPGGDSPAASKTAVAGGSQRLRLLVPAYIYPAGDGQKEWQRLNSAASKVEIVAIANPSSGPGEERNIDYAAAFTEASSAGVKLIGYVSTDYGKRPQAKIKDDVDTWLRFYPQIRGFFFDQQPRESQHAARFAELHTYVKGILRDALVITNPGVPCDQAYFDLGVADVICVFVNYQGFDEFELPSTLQAFSPTRFAAMPYNVGNAATMRSVVKDAIIKRIGYLYISDAKPPNQWGKLPGYWETEVEAISRIH